MSKSTTEIRQAFLDFFYNKDHQIIVGSSLIPKNDSSLLFTNAGMNQFKDIFLNVNKCNYSKVATVQRCVRAGGKHNDLENVGYTMQHHTFFEMLGNFSFGNYFKREAIQYAWELLTDKNWFNLSKERLLVTVYSEDNESYKIWEEEIGIPRERIICIGNNKDKPYTSNNFWQMGNTGPCGPCTEILYDYGDHIYNKKPLEISKEINNRYVELWNIVFMQFNRLADGTIETLQHPSVDTGMGLERIAAVLQNVNSNYDIDLFRKLIASIKQIIGSTNSDNISLRIIADHIRSCAFLISEGVLPSNENRGYVLRRIIRRAIRHGHILGAKEIFFYKLVDPLIDAMGIAGDSLKYHQIQIKKILKDEEEQFSHILKRGLILLNKELEKITGNTLSGEIIFRLYDTYGFPIDLTTEICRERNIKIDKLGLDHAMNHQKKRGRTSNNFKIIDNYNTLSCINKSSEFQGYSNLRLDKVIITALFVEGQAVSYITENQEAIVILDKTPFYAESGGQIGDQGELQGKQNCIFTVNDTKKYNQAIGHIGKLVSGIFKVGDIVQANVNKEHRMCICLNHSATHLMHAALRKILGTHLTQRGFLVTDKILRFDFSHFKKIKRLSDIHAVENLVNLQIRLNIPIKTYVMDFEEAKSKNIILLSNYSYEKYVRVLNIGKFSNELCCGTHATRTGDIGLFRIISEYSIASGIHRIEATTGKFAITNVHLQDNKLHNITKLIKSNQQNLNEKIRSMINHTYLLEEQLKKLRKQIVIQEESNLLKKIIEIKHIKLLVSRINNTEYKTLRFIINNLRKKLDSAIIVLATVIQDRIFLIASVSQNITNYVKAEELVNMISQKIDGKGGGSSSIAQIDGKNIMALSNALISIEDWVKNKLLL